VLKSLTSWPEIVSLHPKDKLEYFLIHPYLEWWFRTGDIETLPSPIPEDGELIIDEQTSVLDGWLAVGTMS
jgi:hypothetical protein